MANDNESKQFSQKSEKASLTQRTLTGLLWNILGTCCHLMLKLFILTVLARLLEPQDFGLVGAALVIVGFSGIFAQLGVGPAIIQRCKLDEVHIRVGFTFSMLMATILSMTVWFLAQVISDFFNMEGLCPVIRVTAIIFLINGLGVVAESLLLRSLQFRGLAMLELLSYAIGYGVVGILLAITNMGVWALVGANIAQILIKTFGALYLAPHSCIPSFNSVALKQLLHFGSGFTLGKIANYLAIQGDNIVVGRFLGAQALGFYGRAYQFVVMPANLFGGVLDKVLFPAMAQIQHEPFKLAQVYRRNIACIALVTLPFSVIFFILAPDIVHILLGTKWSECITPFKILTLGLLFRTSYKASDSLARATGAIFSRAWRQWIYAFSIFGGSWIGQHWGINGVAIAVLLAIIINFALMAHLSLIITKLSLQNFLISHIPAIALAALLGTLTWLIKIATTFLLLPRIVYFVILVPSLICTIPVLWRFWPNVFLGEEGHWVILLITNRLSAQRRTMIYNILKFN